MNRLYVYNRYCLCILQNLSFVPLCKAASHSAQKHPPGSAVTQGTVTYLPSREIRSLVPIRTLQVQTQSSAAADFIPTLLMGSRILIPTRNLVGAEKGERCGWA